MRLAELIRPEPPRPYSRVAFEKEPFLWPTAPCGGRPAADAPNSPDALFLLDTGEISAFCDEYRARLLLSPIATKNRKGALSTRTSANDKAVLKVLCLLMEKAECGCFGAPEETVAQLTHCAPNTAADSLRRLVNAGYVIRHPRRCYGCPTTYTLLLDKLARIPDDAPLGLNELTQIEAIKTGDLRDEAFHARNLGRGTLEVYEQLLKMPPSRVKSIAEVLGKGETNVANHLKKLQTLKMAVRDGWLWSVVTTRVKRDDDLFQITHKMGLVRSDLRAAHEIRRAALLTELRASLDHFSRPDAFDELELNADEQAEIVDSIKTEIADVLAESHKYSKRTKWQKETRAAFEKNVEARFRDFLKRNYTAEQQAVDDVTGDREAGRAAQPVVVTWIRLQRTREIEHEHKSTKK